MAKKREPRDRMNFEVYHTPLSNKKLSGEDLIELAEYCLKYIPFTNGLLVMEKPILTIKQFCEDLAKEMNYHRELDKIEFEKPPKSIFVPLK